MAAPKKVIEEQKQKEDAIQKALAERLEKTMNELEAKRSQSAAMFQNTKVTSCSRIL